MGSITTIDVERHELPLSRHILVTKTYTKQHNCKMKRLMKYETCSTKTSSMSVVCDGVLVRRMGGRG